MTQRRQPKGVPVGGQFAEQPHAEVDIVLVDCRALELAQYAEALAEVEDISPTPKLQQAVFTGSAEQFRVWLDTVVGGDPSTTAAVDGLGRFPFAAGFDFDPVRDERIEGVADLGHEKRFEGVGPVFRTVHLDPECPNRTREKSVKVAGLVKDVFDSEHDVACRSCCGEVQPAARQAHQRNPWVRARESAVEVLQSMENGAPVDLDAVAETIRATVEAGGGSQFGVYSSEVRVSDEDLSRALASINSLTAAVGARCEANGTRKSVEFEAALASTARSMAVSSSGDTAADMEAIGTALRAGHTIDHVAEVVTDARDTAMTRESKVRKRVDEAVRQVTEGAVRLHGDTRMKKTAAPGDIGVPRQWSPLARRIVAAHDTALRYEPYGRTGDDAVTVSFVGDPAPAVSDALVVELLSRAGPRKRPEDVKSFLAQKREQDRQAERRRR